MTNKRLHLPPFAVLRSFECAARYESFTLAAEELHLSPSAVSRKIKALELSVGVELFRRVGRQVILTTAGRNFARDLAVDIERIKQTTYRAIAAGNHAKPLRIATLPTFATRWLIPRLPEFEKIHPEIEVSLGARLGKCDLDGERFDLAIHYGEDDWPGAHLIRLREEKMVAVASPALFDARGLSNPEALHKTPLLHLDSRPGAWNEWLDINDDGERMLPGKRFDQYSMIIAGALASLGAALVPAYLVDADLGAGRLKRIGEHSLKTGKSYFVVRPAGDQSDHASAFIKWICQEAKRPIS